MKPAPSEASRSEGESGDDRENENLETWTVRRSIQRRCDEEDDEDRHRSDEESDNESVGKPRVALPAE